MSDENKSNLPATSDALIDQRTTDLTENDLKQIQEYIDEGLPGIGEVPPEVLKKIMDYYLDGKTYREISNLLKVKKVVIMYMSKRFDWFMMRREYIDEIQSTITNRVIESRLESQVFLLKLVHVWEKKIGKSLDKYLKTGEEPKDGIVDQKEVGQYLKTIEVLQKLTIDSANKLKKPVNQGVSPIGLNVGDGVTIERDGNQMVITPKAKTVSEMLSQVVTMKREQAKKEK